MFSGPFVFLLEMNCITGNSPGELQCSVASDWAAFPRPEKRSLHSSKVVQGAPERTSKKNKKKNERRTGANVAATPRLNQNQSNAGDAFAG